MATPPPRPAQQETRQFHRSCDQCRARKTKCDSMKPCLSCRRAGQVCTRLSQRRRRATVGRNVEAIRRYQAHLASQKHDVTLNSPPRFPNDRLQSLKFGSSSLAENTSSTIHPIPGPIGELPGLTNIEIDDFINWEDDLCSQAESSYQLTSVGVDANDSWHKMDFLPELTTLCNPETSNNNSMRPPILSPSHVSLPSQLSAGTRSFWPESISEQQILLWVEVFFERLHATLPIISRTTIYSSMMSQEHRRNTEFGSMLLALCAFALTQPVQEDEHLSFHERELQASMLLKEAIKIHDKPSLGENPSINTVLTSFFLFGCQFGRGQHNAAWLRLKEAVNLATVLELHDLNSYSKFSQLERDQRLGIFLILSITERGYAIQQRHPIEFKGKPGKTMRTICDGAVASAPKLSTLNIIPQPKSDQISKAGLFQLIDLFDTIGIDEGLIKCWNGQCPSTIGGCQNMDRATALMIHEGLKQVTGCMQEGCELSPSSIVSGEHQNNQLSPLYDTQKIDVGVLQLWLMSRLWHLCFTHDLLAEHSEYPQLTVNYAVTIALSTVGLCKHFSTSAMEVHGVGFIERLYDIGSNALTAIRFLSHRAPKMVSVDTPDTSQYPDSGSASSSFRNLDSVVALETSEFDAIEGISRLLFKLRGGKHPHLHRFLEQKRLVTF